MIYSDTVITVNETETIIIQSVEPVIVTETEFVVIQDTIQTNTVITESESETVVVVNDGFKGDKGDTGLGVPNGGTTGQRLVKKSGTDYDVEWKSQPPAPPVGLDKEIPFNDGGVANSDNNFRWNKNTKTLEIGVQGDEVFPHNPLAMIGSVDDYYQVIVHNETEGISASSDYIAVADNGDDESYYLDLGINSSIYDQPDFNAYKANDAYLYVNGGNLVLNAETTGKQVKIAVGGAKEENIVANFSETKLTLKDHY